MLLKLRSEVQLKLTWLEKNYSKGLNSMKRLIDFLLYPYRKYQEHRAFKRRMEELRKRDPFIYK